jgi:hypothetical protein
MIRKLAFLTALAGVFSYPLVACAGSPAVPKSVQVKLPAGYASYPPGPNVEAMNVNCRGCHSADMVAYQPRMPAKAWTAEVNKMRTVFGAPLPAAMVPQIVAYLVAVKGTPPPDTAAAK